MSIQLTIILAVTKLLNVKKIFTLNGDKLVTSLTKKQAKSDLPKQTQFSGSQQITSTINTHVLYGFETTASDTVVLYLPGGGFVLPITSLHWEYLDGLYQKMPMNLYVGLYPLAPTGNVNDVMDFINQALAFIHKKHPTKKIILMGDSAGGAVSLSFSQSDYETTHLIGGIVAISPIVDLTLTNPQIPLVEKKDTIVATSALYDIREWYRGSHTLIDPLISPIYGEYSNQEILIISGTRDITNPDTHLFAEKFSAIQFIEENGLPHVYPLFGLPESLPANKTILDFLKKYS